MTVVNVVIKYTRIGLPLWSADGTGTVLNSILNAGNLSCSHAFMVDI